MDSTTEVVLKRLEETQHDFWNIARSTGNFLNMLIKMVNAKNVVEVGSDLKFPMSSVGSPSIRVEGLSIAGK